MSNVRKVSPLLPEEVQIFKAVSRSDAAEFCGLLRYHSDENGWFHFLGLGTGQIKVIWSLNGRVTSGIIDDISEGSYYHYDTKGYSLQLGFNCF
jgi:hypothetical protein